MLLSLKLLFYTKSIFCHKVQFSHFFYYLNSVITNLGWMGRIKPQTIWMHFSNNFETLLVILLVNTFVPPNLCMTQSQSSDIIVSSSVFLFFYHLKLVIANPEGTGGRVFPTLLLLVSLNFCMTQNQSSVIRFSYFVFLPSEVSDTNLGWTEGTHPLNIFARGGH